MKLIKKNMYFNLEMYRIERIKTILNNKPVFPLNIYKCIIYNNIFSFKNLLLLKKDTQYHCFLIKEKI